MRKRLLTPMLFGALLCALALPAGLLADDGADGGLVGEVTGKLGIRGDGAVGGLVERVTGDVRNRGEQLVEKVAGLTSKAGSDDKSPSAEATGNRTPVAASLRASGNVQISDFTYQPATINISVGDSVTWTNGDSAPHDARAFDDSFATEIMSEGDSDTVTFSDAGTFEYFCSLHPPEDFPDFTGTVVVAGEGGGSSAGSDSGGGSGDDNSGGGDSTGADTPVSSDDDGSGAVAGSSTGASTNAGAESSGSGSGGSNLASTGQDLRQVALIGALLVGLGLIARRRIPT